MSLVVVETAVSFVADVAEAEVSDCVSDVATTDAVDCVVRFVVVITVVDI